MLKAKCNVSHCVVSMCEYVCTHLNSWREARRQYSQVFPQSLSTHHSVGVPIEKGLTVL